MNLTERQLDFLSRLHVGTRLRLADREEDRIRQGLRKMGLVECVMNPRRWVLTPAGHEAVKGTPRT
jgi:hypothetical protein